MTRMSLCILSFLCLAGAAFSLAPGPARTRPAAPATRSIRMQPVPAANDSIPTQPMPTATDSIPTQPVPAAIDSISARPASPATDSTRTVFLPQVTDSTQTVPTSPAAGSPDTALAQAAPDSLPAPSVRSHEWQPLFGDSLTDATYDPAVWTRENGILTASKDQAIWTKTEYENFELDLEFKTDPGTNSGIVVYCTNIDDWIPNSVEIQIADDHSEKWSRAKPYEQCGAIYGHLGASRQQVVRKPGQWNHIRIRCRGRRIVVILNGKKVTEMNMALWTSGTQNPDGSDIPSWLPVPLAQLPTKGFIGLQGKHGESGIWFRHLRIRPIG